MSTAAYTSTHIVGTRKRGDFAIIGAAGRFAGAPALGALWRSIEEGTSAIGPAPWGSHRGGFLEDTERFDADRFGISDVEASALDPQQRLLLTVAGDALARAPSLDTRSVGVFVAGGQLAYLEAILGAIDAAPKETLAGNLLSMLAARIAHTFDLRGPAFTLDSACSGSLVALHQACLAMSAGDCEAALIGGVNLNLTPLVHTMFERAGALSPTGVLLPFRGDGTLPADGAAIFVLEPLERAIARGHPVWAIIEGTAINNCGRTIGVMTPGPEGQVAVMRSALEAADIASSSVARIEAHATGTEIGDAVELRSIAAVYPHGPLTTTVKAIVGHALGASGSASLLAVIGALKPGERAGVNGFGFGGTNAHVIVRGGEVPPIERARFSEPSAGRVHRIGVVAPDVDGWLHAVGEDGALTPVLGSGADRLLRKGRYVITGASGGIGGVLARFLARNYRAQMVLTGRRASLATDDLVALGSRVTYIAADLSVPSERARVVTEARAVLGSEIDGLFHLAGPSDAVKRGALEDLEALGAKLTVLFSSISGVIAGLDRGIEAYAASNRALDTYARGAPDRVSLDWAPWADVGMAADLAEHYRARGIEPIAPDLAMVAMVRAIAARVPQVAIMKRASIAALPALDWRAVLRALISEQTDMPTASMRDDQHLTALGVDSLAAINVVKALEARAGRSLPTTLLFENDTIEKLAVALERSSPVPLAPPAVVASEALELVDAQRTFLVQQQYFPALPCNVMLSCTVDGLDRGRLQNALEIVLDRHTVLSSVVARRDGRWLQVPGQVRPRLELIDAVDPEVIANQVLDLERGPLIRFVTDGRRLVVNGHHLLIDAWSAKLLVEELLTLHEARDASPSRAPASQTWWTRPAANAPELTDHWTKLFADGVPPIALPYDLAALPEGPAKTVRIALSASVTAKLEALARNSAVSMPALVLASYAEMLFEVSGQHDVTVRVAHARREARIEGIERIVGSFADSLPVRARVGSGLVESARRFHRALGETQKHAGASSLALAKLAERLDVGPQGLTPAGFSFLGLASTPTIGRLRIRDVNGASASGFTRLGLIGWIFDGELVLSYSFLAGHFATGTVERLARGQRAILEGVLDAGRAPKPDRLDQRLVEACRSHGDHELVPGALTYAELDRRSAALASRLDGERVAVMMAPGPRALSGVLGVMRSGAAYVPIDPDWPDARAQAVLQAAEPASIVTSPELADRARAFGLPVHVADETSGTQGPRIRNSEAYVMFTSGSTGGPKGVRVSHRAALTFLEWVEKMLGVSSNDVFLQTSSLAFGGSIRQMYAPILAGASLVIADAATKKDPSQLLRFLRDHRVTIYNSVPSMWSFLMDAIERASAADVASLRWVLLGGEAVPAALVRRWRSLVRGPRVANLYGSTETVVNATWFEISGELPADEALTPIGWPRFGCEAAIEDGALVIRGEIADGYIGTSFQGKYDSGDRVKRASSGALVFVGREDSQVQIHGNRVELGEIEATLCLHEGVDAAVVTHSDGRLRATVEVRRGALPSAEAIRAFVATKLPSYMIPHEIVLSRAMPRTSVGKADRSPVVELWRSVLRLEEVDRDRGFFASGGDSMLAIELVTRIQEKLGVVISPLWLHQHPTLGELIAAVASKSAMKPAVARSTELLSAVQRGFWQVTRPVMRVSVPLRGPIDRQQIARSLRWIQLRHPILRATFEGQRPVQRIGTAPMVELSEVERLIEMRLDRGPLFDVVLGDDGLLIVRAHHIIVDAHSMWILLRELLEDHEGDPEPELGFFRGEAPATDPYWAAAIEPVNVQAGKTTGHRAIIQAPKSTFAHVFAAFSRALQEALDTDDVVVATAVSGREHDPLGLAGAVGPLARGVPVRVRSRDETDSIARLREALAHADSAGPSLLAALGPAATLALGRYFLSWLEPPRAISTAAWEKADLFFDTGSTATEVSIAALAHEGGVTLHLRGGPRVAIIAEKMERALCPSTSALLMYAPAGVTVPFDRPTRIETVKTRFGATDLVLLPLSERDLGGPLHLEAALDVTRARTIALAGMLPSITGLGRTPVGRDTILTTGHAATVVAMERTVELALRTRDRAWRDARVGVLGFGNIGRATLELCVSRLGEPREVTIADPRYGTRVDALYACDLILAATSRGRVLEVDRLQEGAIVIDDSFPRAFDDAAAWRRMDAREDVLLVGGGMWDVGPLIRESPFAAAEALRRDWPVAWLPGCHAEALLVAHQPELGPTIGEVDLARATKVMAAIDALGWTVAPLHLGPRVWSPAPRAPG